MRILGFSARRAVGTALVVPAVLLGLSACGDDGDKASSGDTGTSDKPAASGEVDVDDFFAKVTKAGGAGDTAKFSMDLGGAGTAEGAMAFKESGTPDMSMSMDVEGQSVKMLIVDGTFYMSMAELGEGKYVKLDPEEAGMGDVVSQFEDFTPAKMAESQKAAVTSIKLVGDEDVDGEQLTHYKIEIDPTKLADASGLSDEELATVGDKPLPYDYWVDDDFRLRQFSLEVAGQTVKAKYFDWGQPVDVQAPPAADIMDMSELMGEAG